MARNTDPAHLVLEMQASLSRTCTPPTATRFGNNCPCLLRDVAMENISSKKYQSVRRAHLSHHRNRKKQKKNGTCCAGILHISLPAQSSPPRHTKGGQADVRGAVVVADIPVPTSKGQRGRAAAASARQRKQDVCPHGSVRRRRKIVRTVRTT